MAHQLRRTGRQRFGRQRECHRPRTGNVGDAHLGGCGFVFPATPDRIASFENSFRVRHTEQPTVKKRPAGDDPACSGDRD